MFRQYSRIEAIGTAVPERSISQDMMLEDILSKTPQNRRTRVLLNSIYKRSGIKKRHTVVTNFHGSPELSSFLPIEPERFNGPSTDERNRFFHKKAAQLSVQSARNMLESIPQFDTQGITHIVTASCTGFSAPGFDLAVQKELGLSSSLERFHIGFMGCFAAFPALRTADYICRARPDSKVLVIATELCSIHYKHWFDEDFILANSLFADGSAAALVTGAVGEMNQPGYAIRGFQSRLLPDTNDRMSWMIGDHGFNMTLSARVPEAVSGSIMELANDTAFVAGLDFKSIQGWAIHPGGRAIVDKAKTSLGLNDLQLSASYETLRDYGNMSSATILFVLKRMLEQKAVGPVFAASFGPGLSADSAMLEVC